MEELETKGAPRLSVAFATYCIIDLFGVFPIIALPRPIIDCGWIGIPLAFSVFGIQIYTAILLGRCWTIAEAISPCVRRKTRHPYPAVAELAFGSCAGLLVSVMLDVAVYGAGIPNLIIAAQNMQIIGLKMSESDFDISFCYWLIFLGILLCPIMWLGSPKDMKWLAVLSVGTVFSVAILIWYCIIQDPRTEPAVRKEVSLENVALAYGIIAFQFDIHPTILSVQIDMEKKAEIAQPLLIAFLVTGSLFTITSSLAELKYGSAVFYNILQGLPGTLANYFAIILVSMQIFLSMVIGTSAFFQDIEGKLRIPQEFNSRRCILRSAFVMLLVTIGETVPRFDLIMGLIGGSLIGPLMFILPPIMYCKLKRLEFQHWKQTLQMDKQDSESSSLISHDSYLQILFDGEYVAREVQPRISVYEMVLCATVVVLGLMATFLTTYFSILQTFLYADITPSCIMNFTAASHLLY